MVRAELPGGEQETALLELARTSRLLTLMELKDTQRCWENSDMGRGKGRHF